MSYAVILFNQVLVMFILTLLGYLMFRSGKISSEGSKALGNILIYISLPSVIINSFLVEYSGEKLRELLIAAVFTFAIIVISAAAARLGCRNNAINAFGGAFSNPGFFGVPLITAALGNAAVFYTAPFIAILNLGQWTYGVSILKAADSSGNFVKKSASDKAVSPLHAVSGILERLIKAPFMIAIIIGLFFFLTRIPMPKLLSKCLGFTAGLNTPIAMFTIGIYLAQIDIKRMFGHTGLYLVTAIRLLIIPLITILILSVLPLQFFELKLSILIASACPVGSNVAVYAHLYDSDHGYAVETVIISTLFSIITIPLMVIIATALWYV
ncbi:MAG: AEC family transporter [Eubacteriales bacterium]|nr:AEC family transporter [Eubacteriales bacterium]